jgi:hypothetical protein
MIKYIIGIKAKGKNNDLYSYSGESGEYMLGVILCAKILKYAISHFKKWSCALIKGPNADAKQ